MKYDQSFQLELNKKIVKSYQKTIRKKSKFEEQPSDESDFKSERDAMQAKIQVQKETIEKLMVKNEQLEMENASTKAKYISQVKKTEGLLLQIQQLDAEIVMEQSRNISQMENDTRKIQ